MGVGDGVGPLPHDGILDDGGIKGGGRDGCSQEIGVVAGRFRVLRGPGVLVSAMECSSFSWCLEPFGPGILGRSLQGTERFLRA